VLVNKVHEVGGVGKTLFNVQLTRQKARCRIVTFEPVLPKGNLGVMDISGVNLKRAVSEGYGRHVIGFMELARERLNHFFEMTIFEPLLPVGDLGLDDVCPGANEFSIKQSFEEPRILLKGCWRVVGMEVLELGMKPVPFIWRDFEVGGKVSESWFKLVVGGYDVGFGPWLGGGLKGSKDG
jgi:hypothetical protein